MPYPNEPCYFSFIKGELTKRAIIIYKINNDINFKSTNIIKSNLLLPRESVFESSYERNSHPDLWNWYFTKSTSLNAPIYKEILLTPNVNWFNSNVKIYTFNNNIFHPVDVNNSSWRI